jgi:hypothetical protein
MTPYGISQTVEAGAVAESRAYCLDQDGIRRYAADIEAAYHAARPWTRAGLMAGIKADADAGDPAARRLFVELARMWGPEGMGGEATYESGWEPKEPQEVRS